MINPVKRYTQKIICYQVERVKGRATDARSFYDSLENALEKNRLEIVKDMEHLNIVSSDNEIELKDISI